MGKVRIWVGVRAAGPPFYTTSVGCCYSLDPGSATAWVQAASSSPSSPLVPYPNPDTHHTPHWAGLSCCQAGQPHHSPPPPSPPPQGWSAASLANLMNEAAILTVRRNTPSIDLPLVLELVEAMNFGEEAPKLPPSAAKDR